MSDNDNKLEIDQKFKNKEQANIRHDFISWLTMYVLSANMINACEKYTMKLFYELTWAHTMHVRNILFCQCFKLKATTTWH